MMSPSKERSSNMVVSILAVAALVLAVLTGYLYSENLTLKNMAMNVTETGTKTVTQYTTTCSPEGTPISGTKLKGLESGLNTTSIYCGVRNEGDSSVYIQMAYVNCTPVYFNGTDIYLTITANPIMPNQEAIIAANYRMGTNIRAPGIIYFVIVTGQGEKIILRINVIGGPSPTNMP